MSDLLDFLRTLDQRFPIVDPETGKISDYFLRRLKQQAEGVGGAIIEVEDEAAAALAAAVAAEAAVDALELRNLTAGAGLTGGGNLTADRTFAVGAGTGITVNADDVALSNTAVTPGSYTNTDLTVDAQGRITAAANGSGGGGGGPEWNLAATWDFAVSGSTALPLTFTGLGEFDDLMVTFVGVTVSAGSIFILQVSDNNGSSYYTTSGNYVRWSTGAQSSQTSFAVNGASVLSGFSRAVTVQNCRLQPAVMATAANNTGNPSEMFVGGSSPINAIRLATTAGTPNLTAGVIKVLTR